MQKLLFQKILPLEDIKSKVQVLNPIKLKQTFRRYLQRDNNFFQVIKARPMNSALNITDGFNTQSHLLGQLLLGYFAGLAQLLYTFAKLFFKLHGRTHLKMKGDTYLIEVELRL